MTISFFILYNKVYFFLSNNDYVHYKSITKYWKLLIINIEIIKYKFKR